MVSLRNLARCLSCVIGYAALTVGLTLSVQSALAEELIAEPSVKVVCTSPTYTCKKKTGADECSVQGKGCKDGEDCFCEWDKTVNDVGCKCMK